MRIDVTTLRFALAVVNLTVLGLVGWIAYAFFLGERDELILAMPDEVEYRVKERKRGAVQGGDLRKVLETIYRTKPVPPPIRKPSTPEQDLPAQAGGPLAVDWEVIAVYAARGEIMASIQKKTQAITTGRGTTKRKRTPRTTRPTRSSKSQGKGSTRRGLRPTTKHLVAGETFRVADKTYECEKIEFEAQRLFYRDGGRLYALEPPDLKSRMTLSDAGLLLDGVPLDADEAAALTAAAEEEENGAIDFPGKSVKRAVRPPGRSATTPRRPGKSSGRTKLTREDVKSLKDVIEKSGKAGESKELRKAMQDLEKKK